MLAFVLFILPTHLKREEKVLNIEFWKHMLPINLGQSFTEDQFKSIVSRKVRSDGILIMFISKWV